MGDHRHLVDPAMAFDAADAAVHVNRMVEVDVIRRLVHLDPRHGGATFEARAHHGQQRTLGLHQFMAVHARLRSRKIGKARLVDIAVAIAAVEPELAGVQAVIVRHRLDRRIADPQVLRGTVISDGCRDRSTQDEEIENKLERERIGPLRENV